MDSYALAIIAVVVVAYSLISKRISTTFITGPIIFVTLGLILGPEGLGWIKMGLDSDLAKLLFEATLVLVLFTDAMAINARALRKEAPIPLRLLGIGLPLTIALGLGLAIAMFSGLSFWEAALVGAILAPTDAALGVAVVSNPRVPQSIRHGLNVESGLNDGIVLPIVMIFIEAADATGGLDPSSNYLLTIVKVIIIAAAVGIATGWLGGKAIDYFSKRGWMDSAGRQLGILAMAAFAYVVATPLGASGFIAAWVAGFTLGLVVRDRYQEMHIFIEGLGGLLTMLSFFLFGGIILGTALGDITWQVVLYAILSLTLIRMVPVAVSMIRSGLKLPSVLYLGWFGPRGLASIIFALIILKEAKLPGSDLIVLIMAITVGLSVLLHGVTAWAGSNLYANWYESHADIHGEMKESKRAPKFRLPRVIHRIDN